MHGAPGFVPQQHVPLDNALWIFTLLKPTPKTGERWCGTRRAFSAAGSLCWPAAVEAAEAARYILGGLGNYTGQRQQKPQHQVDEILSSPNFSLPRQESALAPEENVRCRSRCVGRELHEADY
jgi:hypothetical protein